MKTPINFWPSCAPCKNALAPAAMAWPTVKILLAFRRWVSRKSHTISFVIRKPPMKPINVETTRPIKTFSHSSPLTACNPPRAMAAPVSPAINAWDSLVGIPKYQAATVQTTIENKAAANAICETRKLPPESKVTMLLMVSATCALKYVITSTPKKFMTTAMPMAIFGRKTLVETAVAIAFGASVQPLTKITPNDNTIVRNKAIFT